MPGIIAEGTLALPQNEERAEDAAHDEGQASRGEEFHDPVKWDAGDGEHHEAEQDERAAAIPFLPFGPELARLSHGEKAPGNQRDAEDQPAHTVAIEINSSVD